MSDNEKLDNYIKENYPQAWIYYCMAKLFGWTPHEVDELDVNLCKVLIAIEESVSEEISKGTRGIPIQKKRPAPFPKEWENMSVKDIVNSDKFKELQQKDAKVFMTMQEKAGHMLGLK